MRPPVLMTLALLSACSTFPQLDEAVDSDARKAPYPDLVPVETIKGAVPDTQIEPETEEDLDTRIERLKGRAQGLKGTVVDSETRARMKAGIE